MTTLTETAYYSRKAIKFGAIGIVVFFILRLAFSFAVAYYRKLHPPPPPAPTVSFGVLPQIMFPEEKQPVLIYRLETVTGTVPDLGDKAYVYFMPIRQANLLALDKMSQTAKSLDFDGEPEQISNTEYLWAREKPLPADLIADIVLESFSVEVNWAIDSNLLTNKNIVSETQAIADAQRYLQNANLLPEDLLTGTATVTYLKSDINKLVVAVSQSEAEFVRVDFFRKDIEEIPVYTANPDRGVISLVMSGSKVPGKDVVRLNYNYFSVNYEKSGTYPLKTTQEAWAELQSGTGYVAKIDEGVDEVVVRKISLGYFDSAIPQNFLQPIYVFEGDNNFIGYVGAIQTGWIQAEI